MKQLNVLMILCLFIITLSSLELKAQREIGLSLNGFSDFGLVYKVKKSENKYLRYQFAYLESALQGRDNRLGVALNIGFSAGIEKRRLITEDIEFIHGFMPGIGIAGSYNGVTNGSSAVSSGSLFITPTLGYVLGCLYHISDRFYIGLEVLPAVNGSIALSTNNSVAYSFGTNFNIDNVGLSAVYKFSGKD